MSRLYFIDDALGKRRLSETDFPIGIGGKNRGGIVVPESAPDDLFAHIALSSGHAYIQPSSPDAELFHNSERLSESQWLKSGDRVQIGDSLLTWQVQGDKVSIEVLRQLESHTLKPPSDAPPEQTASNHHDMPVHAEKFASKRSGKAGRRIMTAIIALLVLSAIYLLIATPVTIKVEPQPTTLKVKGFPPPVSLLGSRLVLPGTYQIEASLKGHQTLSEQIEVTKDGPAEFVYRLSELPGQVIINTDPAVPVELTVAGESVLLDEDRRAKIFRGSHQLQLKSERYLLHSQDFEVLGFGQEQTLEIELKPAWANVFLTSDPVGADLAIDGVPVGITPLTTEVLQGNRLFTLTRAGFKPLSIDQTVVAGSDIDLDVIKLEPLDGQLAIKSQPAGASVTVNGSFIGTTPLTVDLDADVPHSLSVTKAGYTGVNKTVTVPAEEERTLRVELEAEFGTLFLKTVPTDATILVNGKSTDGNRRLRLPVRKHKLAVRKQGYVEQVLEVTPQSGISQNVEIVLEKEAEQTTPSKTNQQVSTQVKHPPRISVSDGPSLLLIDPDGLLAMGASRREPGRRANESRRQIELLRPLYFAQNEITNQQFRRFKASHDSGQVDNARLNGESQPVVNISWQDAASYCNWLSAEEGLPLAYVESNGELVAVNPMNTGYRLPTEAEWAWVARKQGREDESRYPWKGSYPPSAISGNYADARIADTLADVVPGYDDGHRGTAPIGSFAAWPSGFHDLGGNVAEWIHDYYAVYPGEAEVTVKDPMGPVSGKHYVVRGAGWRHGNITELRLSFRDYSNKPRYDLGFRIARYAE